MGFVNEPENLITIHNISSMGRKGIPYYKQMVCKQILKSTISFLKLGPPEIWTYSWIFCVQGHQWKLETPPKSLLSLSSSKLFLAFFILCCCSPHLLRLVPAKSQPHPATTVETPVGQEEPWLSLSSCTVWMAARAHRKPCNWVARCVALKPDSCPLAMWPWHGVAVVWASVSCLYREAVWGLAGKY